MTGFNGSALNYFFSSDHKMGEDLSFCENYFSNYNFDKLLDIASATGHFTKPFKAEMKVASDISYNMLKTAMERNNIKYLVQCSSDCLTFKDGSFDIAACRIALHHFKNPKLFFNETYRVLKEKGFFVLVDSIVDIDDEYLNTIEYVRDNTHIRSLSVPEIIQYSKNKFRLLTFHTLFKKHNFSEWAERLNPDRKTISKIENAFLELPKNIIKELKVKFENNRIKSYTDKKGIFIFQKL